jgi:purine-binding chemotaxis protein CheW
MANIRYCTFRLDKFLFGITVDHVQEVLRYQQMTRVPLAAKEVKGLINLRGQIVTAIDLRTRLGMSERAGELPPMNVILRIGGGAVSLLVDSIEDVVEVEEALFEPPPNQLAGPARDLVKGVFKLDGQLLLVLDAQRAAEDASVGANAR